MSSLFFTIIFVGFSLILLWNVFIEMAGWHS